MTPPRRPTSVDVARVAGVSRATVSYVLNGNTEQSIPEVTRDRVRAAAKKLGYTPHAAAATLRAGQSRVVLLAIRDVPYGRNVGDLVDRLAARVADFGLTLVVWQAGTGSTLPTLLGHLQPRAALSVLPFTADDVAALDAVGVPHAAIEAYAGESGRDELIGALQVHHLAELGHRVIAHLGTEDAELAAFSRPRRWGVRRGCLELGLPEPHEAFVEVPPKGTIEGVMAVLETWKAYPEPVTAVAAYNDYVAAACLRAAKRLGLRVPEDLAIIGLDDDPMSVLMDPPLSTVRLDMIALADTLLAKGLAAAGQGEEPPPLPSSTLQVIRRGST
jgi:DNA-binding LacI/PurR family transcriptional regulator